MGPANFRHSFRWCLGRLEVAAQPGGAGGEQPDFDAPRPHGQADVEALAGLVEPQFADILLGGPPLVADVRVRRAGCDGGNEERDQSGGPRTPPCPAGHGPDRANWEQEYPQHASAPSWGGWGSSNEEW